MAIVVGLGLLISAGTTPVGELGCLAFANGMIGGDNASTASANAFCCPYGGGNTTHLQVIQTRSVISAFPGEIRVKTICKAADDLWLRLLLPLKIS